MENIFEVPRPNVRDLGVPPGFFLHFGAFSVHMLDVKSAENDGYIASRCRDIKLVHSM